MFYFSIIYVQLRIGDIQDIVNDTSGKLYTSSEAEMVLKSITTTFFQYLIHVEVVIRSRLCIMHKIKIDVSN